MKDYKKIIRIAKENGIDAQDLYVAQEVAWNFGKDYDRFNDICEAVKMIWGKTDHLSYGDICYALYVLTEDERVTIDDVLKGNYGAVTEFAASMKFAESMEFAC